LISVCFAAAACYYYWKDTENERTADVMREQVLRLREDNESLQSEKNHLQASKSDEENQNKAREELIQEKETELAAEELRIDGLGQKAATQSAQNQAQVVMVKKFNDAIKKLAGATPPDVVDRAGRPVLRVPNAQLFAPADATITPEGKALLTQLSQAIGGQMDTFELRLVCYTNTDAELPPVDGMKKDPAGADAHNPAWYLTATRAAALTRFFRDQTQLPTLNVIAVARGDAEPIVSGTGENKTRNARVEITVTPLPPPFHAPDLDKPAAAPAPAGASATSPTTPAAPPKKDKPRKPAAATTP
jgi:flagellar motor protein MotB